VWAFGASSSRFATLVPAAVPVVADDIYDVVVEVQFDVSSSSSLPSSPPVVARASLANVTFAPPPVLHGIELVLDSATAAVSLYTVSVNASAAVAEPLTFTFGLVDHPDEAWAFDLAAGLPGSALSFSAPSTRDFAVLVTVTDAHQSSTTCQLPSSIGSDSSSSSSSSSSTSVVVVVCPIGTNPSQAYDAADVAAEAAALIATESPPADVAVAAFLAGLDAYSDSAATISSSSNSSELDKALEVLLEAFLLHVLHSGDPSRDNNNGTTAQRFLSQDVVVLASAVDAVLAFGTTGSSSSEETNALLLDMIAAVSADLLSDPDVDNATLQLFLATVDAFATAVVSNLVSGGGGANGDIATAAAATINELDATLNDVCLVSEDGLVPDGELTTFSQDSFLVTCSRVETQQQQQLWLQAVESAAALVVFALAGDQLDAGTTTSTITLTTWDSNATGLLTGVMASSSNKSGTDEVVELLSAIVGVHVSGAIDGSSGSDGSNAMASVADVPAFSISIVVSEPTAEAAAGSDLRKAVSCRYFDAERAAWSERGVFLRGLEFRTAAQDVPEDGDDALAGAADDCNGGDDIGLKIVAVCISAHLTLFTLANSSAVVQVVEDKLLVSNCSGSSSNS
jgi:hypothetical protein